MITTNIFGQHYVSDLMLKVVSYKDEYLSLREEFEQTHHISPAESYDRFEGLILYSFVRIFGFKKILEIGTGHGVTSSIMVNALGKNGTPFVLKTIDLKDYSKKVDGVEYITGDANIYDFGDFSPDFLFVDSEHNDLEVLLKMMKNNGIVERLMKTGIPVHFHDIVINSLCYEDTTTTSNESEIVLDIIKSQHSYLNVFYSREAEMFLRGFCNFKQQPNPSIWLW